jgi:hypothetical protein
MTGEETFWFYETRFFVSVYIILFTTAEWEDRVSWLFASYVFAVSVCDEEGDSKQ